MYKMTPIRVRLNLKNFIFISCAVLELLMKVSHRSGSPPPPGEIGLSVGLTGMHLTVNEVSSHLCKILTLIFVRTYLQTGRRRYRIAGRPVVTYYNSAKPPETSNSVRKRPKRIRFPLDAEVEMAFIV